MFEPVALACDAFEYDGILNVTPSTLQRDKDCVLSYTSFFKELSGKNYILWEIDLQRK